MFFLSFAFLNCFFSLSVIKHTSDRGILYIYDCDTMHRAIYMGVGINRFKLPCSFTTGFV